jgi:DNA polymerase-1
MKLLLIDAYALIYRSYYAFIKTPRINSKGKNTSAIFGFINTLEDVLKRESPTHIAVGFDPPTPTFRHDLYEQYKAQREETPEVIRESAPIIKDIIKAYNIPIIEVPRYEADDVIGTIAKQVAKQDFDVYMMTPDKDYAQLVSDHIFVYRPKFGGRYEIMGVKEVIEKFSINSIEQVTDILGLMGDSADNIPGCPGIGEKTAVKLINEFGSVENILANTHKLKGSIKNKIKDNAEQIRFSKFLATIITDVPVTFHVENCAVKKPDKEKLIELYTELEFRNFISKLTDENKKLSPKAPIQTSLFAQFEMEEETIDNSAEKPSISNLASTPHSYYIADSKNEYINLTNIISTQQAFAFDTETDSINPLTARLVGMSFAFTENEAWYVPVPDDYQKALNILSYFSSALLENPHITKIGQNIKFDMLVLRKYGVHIAGPLFDTMIAHYILNPELHHGMDYLAETYLKYNTIHISELIGSKGKNQISMRNVPLEKISEYAAEDADITLKLKHLFEPELGKQGLESLFYDMEMPLVYVLADMEEAGVKLDTVALRQSSETLTSELIRLKTEIFNLAGMEFNINSTKQVGEVLFERLKIEDKAKKTKNGSYSTSEDILEKLRSKHPIISKLLEYRSIKKLLSSYIDTLPELINPETNKIHTSFNQTVTSTGRLSSTNPNLQNIPIRDELGREIRKAFIPDDDGCIFFSADYSQIELRIMAHLSEDENMIAAFRSGLDIHSITAAKIYGIDIKDVNKDMRRKAKTANFGIIYGISAFGLAERLSIPRSEAKELIEGYFFNYPRVREYMDKIILSAKEKGYVETIFKRKRFLPDIYSNNSIVRGYAERNAINAPIQGSAADIIKMAMIRIRQRFEAERLKSKMILQVHDELNFNVFKDEAETIRKTVIHEMENVVSLHVPLVADYGVGANWLEAH